MVARAAGARRWGQSVDAAFFWGKSGDAAADRAACARDLLTAHARRGGVASGSVLFNQSRFKIRKHLACSAEAECEALLISLDSSAPCAPCTGALGESGGCQPRRVAFCQAELPRLDVGAPRGSSTCSRCASSAGRRWNPLFSAPLATPFARGRRLSGRQSAAGSRRPSRLEAMQMLELPMNLSKTPRHGDVLFFQDAVPGSPDPFPGTGFSS